MDEGIETAMVALARRAMRGDKRHQYTMSELKARNAEGYLRVIKRAKAELLSIGETPHWLPTELIAETKGE